MENLSQRLKSKLKRIKLFWEIKLSKKIVIGAKDTQYAGWVSTNKTQLNVLQPRQFRKYWKPNSRESFLAEHVWEYFLPEEALLAARNCYEFLKPGGRLRIAVPDGFHPDPKYIQHVRPGGTGPGAKDHRVLFDHRSLSGILREAGFEVELLEYWDENGQFHFKNWSPEMGHIKRSKRFDPRNQGENLNYTSIIADAIKPTTKS